MNNRSLLLILLFVIAVTVPACLSFRSDIDPGPEPATGRERPAGMSVLFHWTHLEQENGFDVVPKIVPPRRGFRDIVGVSMKELSNIRSFAAFTDNENDIDIAERRALRDSLRRHNDITLHITVHRENSFAGHFFAGIVLWGSLGTVPFPYRWTYTFTAEVQRPDGTIVRRYERTAALTTWYHDLLLFAYPFAPSDSIIEEIYLGSLRSIFRQVEADAVLMP